MLNNNPSRPRSVSFSFSVKGPEPFKDRRASQTSSSTSLFERLKNLGGLNEKEEVEISQKKRYSAERTFKLGRRVPFESLCKTGAECDDRELIKAGLMGLREICKDEVPKNPEKFKKALEIIEKNEKPELIDSLLEELRKTRCTDDIINDANEVQLTLLIKMGIESDDPDLIIGLLPKGDKLAGKIRELFNQKKSGQDIQETLLGFRSWMDIPSA